MMVKMLQFLPRQWYDGEDAPIPAQAQCKACTAVTLAPDQRTLNT